MAEYSILVVSEVVQACDVFLIRWRCVQCHEMAMTDWRSPICTECDEDYAGAALDLPKHRKDFRLLAGTYRRKKKTGITKKMIRNMLALQEGLCAYCGLELNGCYDVEHIIPIGVGGTNNMSNLCISCQRCNKIANSFVFPDFYTKRDYILDKVLK